MLVIAVISLLILVALITIFIIMRLSLVVVLSSSFGQLSEGGSCISIVIMEMRFASGHPGTLISRIPRLQSVTIAVLIIVSLS